MHRPREPLALIGAGGLARETVEAVDQGESCSVVGYYDDNTILHGRQRTGRPVLGGVAEAVASGHRLLLCPGSGTARLRLAARLATLGAGPERYATVVHPAASVSPSSRLGPGCVLLAGSVLTADVELGEHVVLMPNVVLTHDDQLADAVTVCAGVALAGNVRVGPAAYLGAGSLVRENLTVGAEAVLGMGAVVLSDVPAGEVWVGNPARKQVRS